MEYQTHTWTSVLLSWLPFLVLIGFWIFFMRKAGWGGRQGKYIERHLAFMDRQEQLLERVAVALEERNKQSQ